MRVASSEVKEDGDNESLKIPFCSCDELYNRNSNFGKLKETVQLISRVSKNFLVFFG